MTFIFQQEISYRFSATIMWANGSSQIETDLFLLALDSYIVYYVITLAEEQGGYGGPAPKSKIKGAVPHPTVIEGGAEPLHYYPWGI